MIAVVSNSVGFLTDRVGQALNRRNQPVAGRRPAAQGGSSMVAGDRRRRGVAWPQARHHHPNSPAWQALPGPSLRASRRCSRAIRCGSLPSPPGRIQRTGRRRASAWRGLARTKRTVRRLAPQGGRQGGSGASSTRGSAMISFESDRGANFPAPAAEDNDQRRGPRGRRLIQEGSRISYHWQLAGDEPALAAFRRLSRAWVAKANPSNRSTIARPESATRSIRRSAFCAWPHCWR